MSNFKSYLTNWKVVVPVLCGAIIVGTVVYNTDSEESNQTTPAGETAAVQTENVEVEIEAATLEGSTETEATTSDNNENTEK